MARKMFKSCFITGVEIDDNMIIFEDSVQRHWHIDRKSCSTELIKSFKAWFEDVYLKGIPQTLTIFEYSISTNADGESIYVVNSIHVGMSPNGVR